MNRNLTIGKTSVSLKALIGMGLAAVVIIVSLFIPAQSNLPQLGIRTLGVLVAFLIVLISEAMPLIVASLLFVGLLVLTKTAPNLGTALSGFSEKVVWFTLASFGLAAALTSLPLANRLLKTLLKAFGKNIGTVLLALMTATVILSSVISNVPTCAVFSAIAASFCELYENEDDRKKSMRAFMIAIPVASMIGGMMTPAGSSINLIAIGILEENCHVTISFVQWMLAGIPLALVMLPLAWILMLKIYKPAPITKDQIDKFIARMDIPSKWSRQEIYAMVICVTMFVLWILSSWFSFFDVMLIAVIGCALLMFPYIGAISVDTFLKVNSWDAFFLVGTILSISAALARNGVDAFIVTLIPSFSINVILLIGLTAIIVFLSLLLVPVATSLIKILGVPLIALATAAGVNPIMVILTASLCVGNCYLLPLDTVTVITYSKGYYSMTDMLKSTAILQVAMTVLCALYIPLVGLMLGWL
jgi:sodium-dependent dicarboxylate transporter 2/3/5